MSRTSTATKRGSMRFVATIAKVAAGVSILVALVVGPWFALAWAGLVALAPSGPGLGAAAVVAAACLAAAGVSAKRVKSDLRDDAARRLTSALGTEAAQIGTVVLGVRDPIFTMAIRKGMRGSSDVADRVSAWVTPYLALAAVGLAASWEWAFVLGLGALSIWTLNRRSAAARHVDLKPAMLTVASWPKVAAAGVAAGAGWFAWVAVLNAAGHLLAAHTKLWPLTWVASQMQHAVARPVPAVAFGLIVAGWVLGSSAAKEQVRIVRERHILAGPLAKALGITDKLLSELRWEIRQDAAEVIVHGPLPAAAITNAVKLELGLAEHLPDYMVAEATSNRILLREASPEVKASRALLVETGGMVTGVEQDCPIFPEPSEVFALTLEELS